MKKNWMNRLFLPLLVGIILAGSFRAQVMASQKAAENEEVIKLRVCNWEEYIDEGDWDLDETIDLPDGNILGENPMYEDFEEWYYENYGRRVEVEYSCFGTNEELYNMLTLGDVYDLVCPSEYMIMKLMAEDMVQPFSLDFFDEDNEDNYYVRGVSPFIKEAFDTNTINGEAWSAYAAGYMWGITGIVYNPALVTEDEASTWTIITNPKFKRQVTIKDNVRDSLFAALGALKANQLTDPSFIEDQDYRENLAEEMNDVSDSTLELVQDYLQRAKENAYSFETDSGKADMITGKVVAGYQWSGDAVYSMDQAEEDDFYLNFAVPKESTNLYFDGWVMLKSGVEGNVEKQRAAEAFINFLSMPENVVRNMYYIGYTSVIAGGEASAVWDYLKWCYESEEEEAVEYNLDYFFKRDNVEGEYTLSVDEEQLIRQLGAQYPSEEVMQRSAIMQYFDGDKNAKINQMWINVRCYNIYRVPMWVWLLLLVLFVGMLGYMMKKHLSVKRIYREKRG